MVLFIIFYFPLFEAVFEALGPQIYFMQYLRRGGSSRLQREGPKPANADADVIQAHQVYIVGHNHKIRFRKGSQTAFCPHLGLNLARFPPPLDPPVYLRI